MRRSRRAAVLWTGGKDCTLALCRARDAGIEVSRLATFYPAGEKSPFKAHPIDDLRALATATRLEHDLIPVVQPYRDGYIAGLTMLRDTHGIDAIVTGDIDCVNGMPNYIRECAKPLGLDVVMPLWQRPRRELLDDLVDRGIVARISWINSPDIPQAWLGRVIDRVFITDIAALAEGTPIDICGENGEYHTMVEAIPPPRHAASHGLAPIV